jgi:hypothetical protein
MKSQAVLTPGYNKGSDASNSGEEEEPQDIRPDCGAKEACGQAQAALIINSVANIPDPDDDKTANLSEPQAAATDNETVNTSLEGSKTDSSSAASATGTDSDELELLLPVRASTHTQHPPTQQKQKKLFTI